MCFNTQIEFEYLNRQIDISVHEKDKSKTEMKYKKKLKKDKKNGMYGRTPCGVRTKRLTGENKKIKKTECVTPCGTRTSR
jgi:hypothetical protein